MIDRKHIEQFIRLNGLSADSADDDIRSLLINARWHQDDVESALLILRGKHSENQDSRSQTHVTLSSDQKIHPETLNTLLGFNVEVGTVSTEHHASLERRYRSQVYSIFLVSTIGAFLFLIVAMWLMRVGIFHEYALQF